MSRRSKREMAPSPQPFPSSAPSVHGFPPTPPGSSMPGCFPVPPAAVVNTTSGSAAPGPWWCGPPMPQQAPWLPAPSCGGGATSSSSQPVQKVNIDSDPNEWGGDNRPPGGFLSFFNNPWTPPLPQTIPPHLVSGSKRKKSRGMSVSESHQQPQSVINLDIDEDDGNGARLDKRLQWAKPEEVRLVSAWLNNSNDPINGNGKKTDRYWGDVTDEYNSTTPENRRRSSKQLKDHFQKIKKKVAWFCSSWKEAISIWPSGHSDDQIKEKAQAIYEEYKDGPFPYEHCWKILRDQPKWQVILEEAGQSNKRNLNNEGSVTDLMTSLAQPEDRPIGSKKAKKEANKEAKKCPSHMDDVLQQLTKLQGTNESREKMLETQKHVSSEKLESARLNHLAAKENAKSAMLETYRALSMKDTSGMPDDVKAEHLAFLRCVRESIFGTTRSDSNGSS